MFSPDDSANFLQFLIALRKQAGNKVLITAAVGVQPGDGYKNGTGFAKALDSIRGL
jgi:hypothetical protein